MSWRDWLRLGLVLTSGAALCGALPGEINGCDTDLSDEIAHDAYCRDRCAAICERVVTCGLYLPPDELPEGTTAESLCRGDCERHYFCDHPQLCQADTYDPYPYVSIKEAETCLQDWNDVSCDELISGAPACGDDFSQCPRIETCTGEVLCDPPEWE